MMNHNYLIRHKGQLYVYYCTKKDKLSAYAAGKAIRKEHPRSRYVITKGRKWGYNVYLHNYWRGNGW